jgi:acetyltransferase
MLVKDLTAPRATPVPSGRVHIRPVQAADAPELQQFYAGLSPESRRRRFLGSIGGLTLAQVERLCRYGFVAALAEDGGERIVGHLCLMPIEPDAEEVAVVVGDAWQRQGIGRALYAAALRSAEARGIHRLEATMFAYNAPIRRLLTGAGRPYRIESDELGTLYLTINLDTPLRGDRSRT